jgi:transposase-like protein
MITDRLAPQTGKCGCGRNANEVHCPDCGSIAIEGKTRSERLVVDGRVIDVRVWRCRRCGYRFNDVNRATCNAPALQLLVSEQRKLDTAQTAIETIATSIGQDESLSYDERKAKLFELLSGKKPTKPRGEQE